MTINSYFLWAPDARGRQIGQHVSLLLQNSYFQIDFIHASRNQTYMTFIFQLPCFNICSSVFILIVLTSKANTCHNFRETQRQFCKAMNCICVPLNRLKPSRHICMGALRGYCSSACDWVRLIEQ